ncbi:MAG: hypothetical protein ACTSVI_12400 [Promethearchaeota archaeon]
MDEIEVFKILDTGEYTPVDGVTIENVEDFLDEQEVFIILYPGVRRLYIWKGRKSTVQKKFISSRVAHKIQKEKVRNAGMQHKIVSIDQDDELDEFIKNLGLKNVKTEAERKAEQKKKEEEEARRFEELMKKPDIEPEESTKKDVVKASPYLANFMKKINVTSVLGPSAGMNAGIAARMTDKEKQEILDTLLKQSTPDGYVREHLILDEELYVNMKKKAVVFDKEVEVETWDAFNGVLENGFLDINDRSLRLYIKDNKIKAVEILKQEGEKNQKNENAVEIKEKKESTEEQEIKEPSTNDSGMSLKQDSLSETPVIESTAPRKLKPIPGATLENDSNME